MHTPEQRQSERSSPEKSEHTVSVVDVESGVEFSGDVRNVSLAGLLFHAHMQPVVGADMELTFEHPDSPTLHAKLHVVRVESQADGYDIAGHLRR